MTHAEKTIRKPAVAGQFYPAAPEQLQGMLSQCIPAAPPESQVHGRIRALIVPHAGYQFSGRTAGEAYALLRGQANINRVVVLSPSHRVPFNGISLGGYDAFETPLGQIPVDTVVCRQLQEANSLFSDRKDAHEFEHALEVQLPFLQSVLGDFRLVPAVCGQMRPADEEKIAATLAAQLWRPDTVWIVSSDFTHYGTNFGYVPFHRNVPNRLRELDEGALDCICDLNARGFAQYLDDTGTTICGAGPIRILLLALEQDGEALDCHRIKYTTSGEITGDYSHSVSYASLAVTAKETQAAGGAADSEEADTGFTLSEEAKAKLLELARESIHSRLAEGRTPAPQAADLPAVLREFACSFVTLHLNGRLRGCIGSLQVREPLFENVLRNARNAAFHDPRFRPLSPSEFEVLEIEISVLTPARPISGPEQFIPGKHGIILKKGALQSVFLPQVATGQGWDRETTLTHLALKAGLGPDEWRSGCQFEVFEAIVFGE